MADVRISALPDEPAPSGTDFVPIDLVTTRKTTVTLLTEAGRPAASQAEAEAGVNPTKAMTPLTTSQAISAQGTAQFVPLSRTISAGTGLTGGGNLTTDRSLALSAGTISSLVPIGGTTGQVLTKASNTDFDDTWTNAGTGDMAKATYDPTNVAADAFNSNFAKYNGFPLNGGVVQAVAAKLRELVSVMDFGAVGDGVTNDAVAIQAAVNYALTIGAITWFPPTGLDYICNSQILVDATLAGIGRYGGAITLMGAGPRSCIRSNSIATSLIRYQGNLATDESHFRVANLKITGNTTTPVAGSKGISLNAGAWMTFDNFDIEGFDLGVDAVDVDQVAWYNCNIAFNLRGLFANVASSITSANSWMFVNCLIRANKTYGMYLKNANAFSFIGGSVQGNGRIGVAANWGVWLEEAGDGYGNVLFEGMAFESNAGVSDFVSTQTTNQACVVFNSVAFLRSVPQITAITGAVNNGSGLIRLTTPTTNYATGMKLFVASVGGVPNATGEWTVTVIDATHMDLQASTFAGTYTSGGIATYLGYATNQIYADGTNANTTYSMRGCTFRSLAPYVASASRPYLTLINTNAKVDADDGTNYFQNAVEKTVIPLAQTIGAKTGPWTVTTPTVTTSGTPGTFAATCSMRTQRSGKLVQVNMTVTVTNAGSATGFQVAYPFTPSANTIISGVNATLFLAYNWFSSSGALINGVTGSLTPVVGTFIFSGTYEAA